jgi:DNA sulfur modification protein DndB
MIHLACLRGNIGFWTYYSTVIKIRDVVSDNRIITVGESDELFTKNINKVLQREINDGRIGRISEYILNTDERFFSSLVVAIHRGNPKWTDINLRERFRINDNGLSEEEISSIGSKYGILSLNGDEQIFALDGQHRLLGIRKAHKADPSIGDLEISLTFVIHNHDKVEKTRRLFTVLNKYAEKPKGAELIILDEDDVAAINTRRLVMEHPILSNVNAISNSKTGAISNGDEKSFTTLVTINNINKILYGKDRHFYARRPSDEEIDQLYRRSALFWDALFEVYPEIVVFLNGETAIEILDKKISRTEITGGNLLMRPVGQELIAKAFTQFQENELEEFKLKLRKIDFDLSSNNWKYVFWNGKMLGKELKLKNNLLFFMLGKFNDRNYIIREMRRIYGLNNQEYNDDIIQRVE